MKKIIFFCLSFIVAQNSFALTIDGDPSATATEVFQAYRQLKEIGEISSIQVPTVVEVPLDRENNLERWEFAVYDVDGGVFEPNMYRTDPIRNQARFSIGAEPYHRETVRFAERMIDRDANSFADILLPAQGQGTVAFTMTADRPVTSSGFTVLLDRHAALPTDIEVHAVVEGENRIVFAKSRMLQNTIRFPQITSSKWTIVLFYGQPLRITELRLLDESTSAIKRGVRFLAQPGRAYRLYLDPDRFIRPHTGQSANLTIDKGVLRIASVLSTINPLYRPADIDKDGVPDIIDNCVSIANQNQEDVDGNRRGDACDDFDRDGLINQKDNCPDTPNTNQRDEDGDGVGDVCDGEESRITERHPWIPWVGMGAAGMVLVILFVLAARSMPKGGSTSGSEMAGYGGDMKTKTPPEAIKRESINRISKNEDVN